MLKSGTQPKYTYFNKPVKPTRTVQKIEPIENGLIVTCFDDKTANALTTKLQHTYVVKQAEPNCNDVNYPSYNRSDKQFIFTGDKKGLLFILDLLKKQDFIKNEYHEACKETMKSLKQ